MSRSQLRMTLLVILSVPIVVGCAYNEEFFRNYNNCDGKIYRSDGTVDYVCSGSDTDLKYGK